MIFLRGNWTDKPLTARPTCARAISVAVLEIVGLPYAGRAPDTVPDKAATECSVLLTGRPHRLPAKRDPEILARQLGFFYLPRDRIAFNPGCRIVVEPFIPKDEIDFHRRADAVTRLTLDRSGLKRTLLIDTDHATVVEILNTPPLRRSLLDRAPLRGDTQVLSDQLPPDA